MIDSKRLSIRRASFLRPVAVVGGLGLTILSPSNALAAPEGTMGTFSLGLTTQGIFAAVRVQSENGKTWTKIKNDNLTLGGPITVDMKTGR
ncbi:MAG TPA: hypothetical protein VFY21_07205, partial [Xanthobacteraceae bacterium]|nr:hypothetical protein [Xanthobacteraceae bacterium]